jgi:hypothetical protein
MRAAGALLTAAFTLLSAGSVAADEQACADLGVAPGQGPYSDELQKISADIEHLLPGAAEAAGVRDFALQGYALAYCGIMRDGRKHILVLGSKYKTLVITCDSPENFSVDYDINQDRLGLMTFGVKTC